MNDDDTIDLNRAKRDDRATGDEKDGRARIVDPPRYEEVGITGLLAAVMTIIFIFWTRYLQNASLCNLRIRKRGCLLVLAYLFSLMLCARSKVF